MGAAYHVSNEQCYASREAGEEVLLVEAQQGVVAPRFIPLPLEANGFRSCARHDFTPETASTTGGMALALCACSLV